MGNVKGSLDWIVDHFFLFFLDRSDDPGAALRGAGPWTPAFTELAHKLLTAACNDPDGGERFRAHWNNEVVLMWNPNNVAALVTKGCLMANRPV